MKFIVWGAGGVIENAIELGGHNNLCCMLYEEPDDIKDIFDSIGFRFVKQIEICRKHKKDPCNVAMASKKGGYALETGNSVP
jgi:hypothetical protein